MAPVNGGFEFILAGVPVRVQWFFFLTAALIGFNFMNVPTFFAIFIGIVFVSVLLHEMAHAAVYRAYGVAPRILLQGFGGLTFGRSLSSGRHVLVSVAGPATNLLLSVSAYYAYLHVNTRSPELLFLLFETAQVNLFWAIFNILPIMPLDGGNATSSLLSVIFKRDMTPTARILSILTGALVIGYLLKVRQTYAALFIAYFVFLNFQALGSRGPGQFRPTIIKPPKPERTGRRARKAGTNAPPAPTSRPVDASPTGPRPSSPIDTTGWQVPSTRRTFDQEIDTVLDALTGDSPELASIAVDRARRLARTPEQHAVADQLQAEILRRISG